MESTMYASISRETRKRSVTRCIEAPTASAISEAVMSKRFIAVLLSISKAFADSGSPPSGPTPIAVAAFCALEVSFGR